MKLKHRILTLLLSLSMLVTFMPAIAYADDPAPSVSVEVTAGKGSELGPDKKVDAGSTVKYNISVNAGNSSISKINAWLHTPNGNESYPVDLSSGELSFSPEIGGFWQLGAIEVYTPDGDYMFVNEHYYPSEVTAEYDAVTTPENCDEFIYSLFTVSDSNFDNVAFWYNQNPGEVTDRTRIEEDNDPPEIANEDKISVDKTEAKYGEFVNYKFEVKENDRLLYAKVFFEDAQTGEAAGSDIADISREDSDEGYGAPIKDGDFTVYSCYTKFYREGRFRVAYIEAKDIHGNVAVFRNTKSEIAKSMTVQGEADLDNLTVSISPHESTGKIQASGIDGELVQLNTGELSLEVRINDEELENYSLSNFESDGIYITFRTDKNGEYFNNCNCDIGNSVITEDGEWVLKFKPKGFAYNGNWYISNLWIEQYAEAGFEKAYIDDRCAEISRSADFNEVNYEIVNFGAGSFNVGKWDKEGNIFATGSALDENADVEVKACDQVVESEMLEKGYDLVSSHDIHIDSESIEEGKSAKVYIKAGDDLNNEDVKIRHKLSNGSYQEKTATVTNGMVDIDVEEFSPFLIEKFNPKEALSAKIAEANALDSRLYTEDSWVALQTAVTDATAVLNDTGSTDDDYETARNAVQAAIDALVVHSEHTYGAWKTIKAATCTDPGSKERVCSACGYKDTATIPATGHSWTSSVSKNATEFEMGHMTHRCTKCGTSYATAIPTITLTTDLTGVKMSKPKGAKGKITVKWKKPKKKVLSSIDGIEIRVVGPGVDTITTAGKKKNSKKIGGLMRKQSYTVQVRTYAYINGEKHVSAWKTKKVKTK